MPKVIQMTIPRGWMATNKEMDTVITKPPVALLPFWLISSLKMQKIMFQKLWSQKSVLLLGQLVVFQETRERTRIEAECHSNCCDNAWDLFLSHLGQGYYLCAWKWHSWGHHRLALNCYMRHLGRREKFHVVVKLLFIVAYYPGTRETQSQHLTLF